MARQPVAYTKVGASERFQWSYADHPNLQPDANGDYDAIASATFPAQTGLTFSDVLVGDDSLTVQARITFAAAGDYEVGPWAVTDNLDGSHDTIPFLEPGIINVRA